MTLIGRFWHALATWLTMSPLGSPPAQHPLGVPITHSPDVDVDVLSDAPGRFHPPAGNPKNPGFTCDYSAMKGWYPCSTPEDRGCWLRHPDGREFNLHTNYENFAPVGITRKYTLNITDTSFNADGQPFDEAKLFNNQYPGPWLEACWGDTINVTVINSMFTSKEGTSIHWHGIRQNRTFGMDGVNGITQCPIAPGDSFTYSFKAVQYGTSWYHSHYSVQYADGLQGPLTIYGPHSAPYDASKTPLLMTDWAHNSAIDILRFGQFGNKTILLNGRGNVSHYQDANKTNYVPTLPIPKQYELHFNETPTDVPCRPTRYLLRIINTSFESTFVFSIDNHWLQVVTSDFVPIVPYFNTSILVGIGQRYNVIVEATPRAGDMNPIPRDGNYWIRTWIAGEKDGDCGVLPGGKGYEKTGILRYNEASTALPSTNPWVGISIRCSDETYSSLRPKQPWFVGPAANSLGDSDMVGEKFNVTLSTTHPPIPNYPLAFFSLQRSGNSDFTPLQINYSDPIVLHLDESGNAWPKQWVVIPENYGENEWIYLVLTMNEGSSRTRAHPIHLHGHDFALLQQVENQRYDRSKLNLKLDNPPRRDVVLLPNDGFVVIAFKSDNPGSWLMHCHIARHASEGLALQILERQQDASKLIPKGSPAKKEAERVCRNWAAWRTANEKDIFEGDSGI